MLKLLGGKEITAKDATTALLLIDMSFASPRTIRREYNRQPRNTLLLLDYLDQRVKDAPTREKINLARQRMLHPSDTAPQK